MGVGLSRGVSAGSDCALVRARPLPRQGVLRIAARRPSAALDPGASAGPGTGVIGQAKACPMGARSPGPLPLRGVDRVVVTRAGSSTGKVASFVHARFQVFV